MTNKFDTVAREIVEKVNKEYGDETFVSSAYGYYDDIVEAIAQALERVHQEALQAKVVLPRTDNFDPDESSLFLAGVEYALSNLRRLNPSVKFEEMR